MQVVDINAVGEQGGSLGRYRVVERREDGTLVLAPETVEDVAEAFGDRTLSEKEFLEASERAVQASRRPD